MSVTTNTTTNECIGFTLASLEMGTLNPANFQLWVKLPLDSAPYPLIGYENVYAIKQNFVRQSNPECDGSNCNNNMCKAAEAKCQFTLRQKYETNELNAKKISKKARKSPIRLQKMFKRSNSKGDSLDGAANGPNTPPVPTGLLYCRPLQDLFEANNNELPKPITVSIEFLRYCNSWHSCI